jgi:hypothetical protein
MAVALCSEQKRTNYTRPEDESNPASSSRYDLRDVVRTMAMEIIENVTSYDRSQLCLQCASGTNS